MSFLEVIAAIEHGAFLPIHSQRARGRGDGFRCLAPQAPGEIARRIVAHVEI